MMKLYNLHMTMVWISFTYLLRPECERDNIVQINPSHDDPRKTDHEDADPGGDPAAVPGRVHYRYKPVHCEGQQDQDHAVPGALHVTEGQDCMVQIARRC